MNIHEGKGKTISPEPLSGIVISTNFIGMSMIHRWSVSICSKI